MAACAARCSLLYADPARLSQTESAEQPAIFGDLNLDQVVAAVCSLRPDYDLAPYFYLPLTSADEVDYRHQVVADLSAGSVAACLATFAEKMRSVRARQKQAGKLRHRYQRDRWLLDATGTYCSAARSFADSLAGQPVTSAAMTALSSYLCDYIAADSFVTMEQETRRVQRELDEITYTVSIRGSTVTVDDFHDEADYSTEVLDTFERFRTGDVVSHLVDFSESVEVSGVEGQILDRVALLRPDVFEALERHAARYADCIDPTVANAERETQFYQAYLTFVERLKDTGLTVSVPEVRTDLKDVKALDSFDIALADKLVRDDRPVVCNDVTLHGPERMIVVTGPNQGGKTTFSRMFGQLHYLGSIGLPVPGREVRLLLPDRIFTHYERGENVAEHVSKLEDELIRVHQILRAATDRSVVVINEIFTSTTLSDAIDLGSRVLRDLIDADAVCLCVTFVDELSQLGDSVVSMVSTIADDNPADRTFKVVRRPADGLAYAAAIADKYGLTYRRVLDRIAS
jgi:hypothetical protein